MTGDVGEPIDKLTEATIELRTTLRIGFTIVGIGFPLMIWLLTFLVIRSFSTSARVDRLSDQIATTRSDYTRLAERQYRLEHPSRP